MKAKLYRFWPAILSAFLILIPIAVFAADETSFTDMIKNGDMNGVRSNLFHLNIMYHEAAMPSIVSMVVNGLAGLIWALAVGIYNIFDFLLQFLTSNSIFQGLYSNVFTMSKSLFNNLWSVFGLLIIIYGMIKVIGEYAKSGRVNNLFKLFITTFITFLWFSSFGGFILQKVNEGIDIAGGQIIQGVQIENIKGNEADGATVEIKDSTQGDQIRKSYFNSSIYNSWKLMHFGKTEFDEKEQADVNSLLNAPADEQDKIANDLDSKDGATSSKGFGKFLWPEQYTYRIQAAIAGLINVIIKGIPYLLISFLIILFKMLFAVMLFGLPISAIFQFVPGHENAFTTALANTFKMLGWSLVGGVLAIVLNLTDYVSSTLVTNSAGGQLKAQVGDGLFQTLSQSVLFIAILFAIWKFKDKLINLITGGRVIAPSSWSTGGSGLAASIRDRLNKGEEQAKNSLGQNHQGDNNQSANNNSIDDPRNKAQEAIKDTNPNDFKDPEIDPRQQAQDELDNNPNLNSSLDLDEKLDESSLKRPEVDPADVATQEAVKEVDSKDIEPKIPSTDNSSQVDSSKVNDDFRKNLADLDNKYAQKSKAKKTTTKKTTKKPKESSKSPRKAIKD